MVRYFAILFGNLRDRPSRDAPDRHGTTPIRGRKWHTYRHSGCRASGRLQKRGSHGCRDIDRDEAVRREQVVLAALVDNAEVAALLGLLVRNDDVDFVALEGNLVAAVVHANGEST